MNVSFQCRSCGGTAGQEILNLGIQPLANNLLRAEDLGKPEPKFPLRLAVCLDCWLLQITDLVPPTDLFSEYLYFSSFSDALLRHARQAAERYISEFGLDGKSHVVEIASNDGYLLQNMVRAGVPCLGIEPARNIAKVAREKGIPTLEEFFGSALAARLAEEDGQADLILGNNVFAHVPGINDFVAGLRILLKPSGRVILEFPYAMDMLENTEFDTIYHEHVFYFTLTALTPLFRRHGLEIFHVERLPIHGGSLRLFAGHSGAHPVQSGVGGLLEAERVKNTASVACYNDFARKVEGIRDNLVDLVRRLKREGKKLAVYGASAKGSTLLNYFGLGREFFEFMADRSSYKQGRFSPGMHIPIVSPEELSARQPDYTLLLTWNFASEIMEQQGDYRRCGGKFIVPIPHVHIT